MDALLPYLAAVCKRTRLEAGEGPAIVAGYAGYKASTSISRTFEGAQSWPQDPDKVVAAYARIGPATPEEIWTEATERFRKRSPVSPAEFAAAAARGATADARAPR